MRSNLRQALAALVTLSSLLGISSVANADVAACVRAHATGQREAKAGRLEAASELFAGCVSEPSCPDAIRAECAEFYKSSERNLPTLIFAVLDEQGSDLIQVRVSADDRVLTESLDGRPIALDPGHHHLKFELASGQVLESDVLVREGEKNRIVSVRSKAEATPADEAPSKNPDAAGARAGLPVGFWVASGVGAAALVSFGAFALVGYGKQSTLGDCSPNCSSSSRADYDAMRRDYLIADISLGVAVASAGVATWLFFSNRHSSEAEKQAASTRFSNLSVTPLVSARGAGLVLSATAF